MKYRPGDVVHHFRIAREIRSGGFGTVYRARHLVDRSDVALKILKEDWLDSSAVRRFEHEASILSELRHRNIVRLLEHGALPAGNPYMAMELLHGVDLDCELRTRGRLPVDELVPIVEPLCHALEAVHAHGIIHRDLKPSNVFLCREVDTRRVVLLDFGVAKIHAIQGLTMSGQVIGTVAFMAPEQLLQRPIDARTDVYGLGALVFNVLAGCTPFAGMTPLERATTSDVTPRLSRFVNVSPAMDELLARAMSPIASERFATAGDFLAALRSTVQSALMSAAPARSPASPGSPVDTRETEVVRHHLVVDVRARVDGHALEDPDDELLDDLESVLPAAIAMLEDAGLRLTGQAGNMANLSMPLPDDASERLAVQTRAILDSVHTLERLARREYADERVAVTLALFIEDGPEERTVFAHYRQEYRDEVTLVAGDAVAAQLKQALAAESLRMTRQPRGYHTITRHE